MTAAPSPPGAAGYARAAGVCALIAAALSVVIPNVGVLWFSPLAVILGIIAMKGGAKGYGIGVIVIVTVNMALSPIFWLNIGAGSTPPWATANQIVTYIGVFGVLGMIVMLLSGRVWTSAAAVVVGLIGVGIYWQIRQPRVTPAAPQVTATGSSSTPIGGAKSPQQTPTKPSPEPTITNAPDRVHTDPETGAGRFGSLEGTCLDVTMAQRSISDPKFALHLFDCKTQRSSIRFVAAVQGEGFGWESGDVGAKPVYLNFTPASRSDSHSDVWALKADSGLRVGQDVLLPPGKWVEFHPAPIVRVKGNREGGPITLKQGESLVISWTSEPAVDPYLSCYKSGGTGTWNPTTAGRSNTSGSATFIPTATTMVAFTCTNAFGVARDSILVRISP